MELNEVIDTMCYSIKDCKNNCTECPFYNENNLKTFIQNTLGYEIV